MDFAAKLAIFQESAKLYGKKMRNKNSTCNIPTDKLQISIHSITFHNYLRFI